MNPERITATYLIETAYDPEEAAMILAGEQSCGTFVRTPGETDELRRKHAAQIEGINTLGEVPGPTLPGARAIHNAPVTRAEVTISWPYENIGSNLTALFSTLAGNLFELAPFSGLKLLDFHVPHLFVERYQGPKFGIGGTRNLSGVYNRPIIGTIIKPSVGLSPEKAADQTKIMIRAGLDFLKDDELQCDSPHSPFHKRVTKIMNVIDQYASRENRKPMYAFNVTDDIDGMKKKHDYVLASGGTCIMVNINAVGIAGVREVVRHSQLPVHGHRCGWGIYSRSPVLGIAFAAYQKFWRLAGVDHMHTNGLRNKFCESDSVVISSIGECQSEFHNLTCPMPVLSSGQWAGQTVDTYKAIRNTDLMYLCGGGIVSHPDGIAAGVKSIRQGWEAALTGVSLEEYADTHMELASALRFFEKKAK